jgi:5-methylthioadenosine/S-adenosylhomocysteine deaminase
MKLASGAAPIAGALGRHINVGLGTDGCASNNRLDMFQEMRMAALLGKVTGNDASVLDCHEVLRMATLGGAIALSLGAQTGSLSPGKQADLCAVRLDQWISKPVFDPASHLVYVAGREDVSDVWVAGKRHVANGQLVNIDTGELSAIGTLWQNRLMS